MGILGTLIVYGVLGVVVAAAMALVRRALVSPLRLAALVVLWSVCWPFFAPTLLGRAVAAAPRPDPSPRMPGVAAGFAERLKEVEARLLAALSTLPRVADEIIRLELEQVPHLVRALARVEARLAEVEALLATPEFDALRAQAILADLRARGIDGEDARAASVGARLANIRRLLERRERLSEALERGVLKIEEMTSQVLLLRFADRPEEKLVELFQEMSAALENAGEG